MLNTDVVYKIECKNYDAAHVDQIRRSKLELANIEIILISKIKD